MDTQTGKKKGRSFSLTDKELSFARGNQAAAKPESERRVPVSFRLPPDAAAKLRAHASKDRSQGDIVAELLRRWEPEREPVK